MNRTGVGLMGGNYSLMNKTDVRNKIIDNYKHKLR